jgi:endonuclease G
MRYKSFIIPLFLGVVGTVCSCAHWEDEDELDAGYVEITQENDNANTKAGALGWEVPRLNDENIFIEHSDQGIQTYCLEYNRPTYHSNWVAYRYDSRTAKSNVSRSDAWAADTALNNYPESQLAVQYFPGYNRGHLVGSAERLYTLTANQQTFFMTNMSPMLSAFNNDYWGYIEDLCRDQWGRKCGDGDTLYVVKGGTIKEDQILGKLQLRNTLGNTVEMVIPKYYYMACLKLNADGTATAIAFLMEHKNYNNTTSAYLKSLARASVMSVDELEEFTGIDFFCNVPDWIENHVEAHYSISNWAGL